jgi:hypothetical protein
MPLRDVQNWISLTRLLECQTFPLSQTAENAGIHANYLVL